VGVQGLPWFKTNATEAVGSSKISRGSPHAFAVAQVVAFELISDRLPLPKLMAKELTLSPAPLIPCVRTYRSPEGLEEELPQLSKNKLKAHMATNAKTPPIFFDIYSPKAPRSTRFPAIKVVSRFPFAGDLPPAVTETAACG
jgi:hypothetical protein